MCAAPLHIALLHSPHLYPVRARAEVVLSSATWAAAESPTLFVFGLGYVGLRLGLQALAAGWHVSGSVRDAGRAHALRLATGIEVHTFDLDDAYAGLDTGGLDSLRQATHVLATVPPIADRNRDPLIALHRESLIEADFLRWAGYLSSTSVYGDHAGAWVDERSPTRPLQGSAAEDRLRAEAEWLGLHDATSGRIGARVFRLAGIYGPGRSALGTVRRAAAQRVGLQVADSRSRSIARSEPNTATPTRSVPTTSAARYVSRIHVDDACSALLASMEHDFSVDPGGSSAIFNLADDEPAPRSDVMSYAAMLLNAPAQAATEADALGSGTPRARRRASESKRVSNRLMRSILLPQGLAYSNYREGLDACLAEDGDASLLDS